MNAIARLAAAAILVAVVVGAMVMNPTARRTALVGALAGALVVGGVLSTTRAARVVDPAVWFVAAAVVLGVLGLAMRPVRVRREEGKVLR